jgi:Na+-translocating ferredoxin:NAD+ oxidoreductase RnfG subunit
VHIIALVSFVTAKPIADAKAAQQRKAVSQVLPAFDNYPAQLVFETKTASGTAVKFMGDKKDGKLIAIAAIASADFWFLPLALASIRSPMKTPRSYSFL